MKALPLFAAALTLLATALPAAQPADASTGIQRCRDADGRTIYTDRACASFDARTEAIPAALHASIRQQAVLEAELHGGPAPDIGPADTLPTAGRRSLADGCARSTTQLAMDLQGAFALGDVNRLAESWHWAGMSSAQARPVMARIESLSRQPLRDLRFFDARIGPDALQFADASGAADGGAGIIQLMVGRASPDVLDLGVQRYHGCYFVRF